MPALITMLCECAGLLRKQEEQESEGALVAPLLQEVAAEVQHFVAASGFSRMPTRLELKQAGTATSLSSDLADQYSMFTDFARSSLLCLGVGESSSMPCQG